MNNLIFDSVPITDTLLSLESALQISANEEEVVATIDGALRRLSNQYGVEFTGKESFYHIMDNNPHIITKLESLLAMIGESLKRFSLLQGSCVATGIYTDTLASVHYLMLDPNNLAGCLKFLIHRQLYPKRDSFMSQLYAATTRLPNSQMRRILICLLVLEKLDLFEGVSIIAQYLYMGVRAS